MALTREAIHSRQENSNEVGYNYWLTRMDYAKGEDCEMDISNLIKCAEDGFSKAARYDDHFNWEVNSHVYEQEGVYSFRLQTIPYTHGVHRWKIWLPYICQASQG